MADRILLLILILFCLTDVCRVLGLSLPSDRNERHQQHPHHHGSDDIIEDEEEDIHVKVQEIDKDIKHDEHIISDRSLVNRPEKGKREKTAHVERRTSKGVLEEVAENSAKSDVGLGDPEAGSRPKSTVKVKKRHESGNEGDHRSLKYRDVSTPANEMMDEMHFFKSHAEPDAGQWKGQEHSEPLHAMPPEAGDPSGAAEHFSEHDLDQVNSASGYSQTNRVPAKKDVNSSGRAHERSSSYSNNLNQRNLQARDYNGPDAVDFHLEHRHDQLVRKSPVGQSIEPQGDRRMDDDYPNRLDERSGEVAFSADVSGSEETNFDKVSKTQNMAGNGPRYFSESDVEERKKRKELEESIFEIKDNDQEVENDVNTNKLDIDILLNKPEEDGLGSKSPTADTGDAIKSDEQARYPMVVVDEEDIKILDKEAHQTEKKEMVEGDDKSAVQPHSSEEDTQDLMERDSDEDSNAEKLSSIFNDAQKRVNALFAGKKPKRQELSKSPVKNSLSSTNSEVGPLEMRNPSLNNVEIDESSVDVPQIFFPRAPQQKYKRKQQSLALRRNGKDIAKATSQKSEQPIVEIRDRDVSRNFSAMPRTNLKIEQKRFRENELEPQRRVISSRSSNSGTKSVQRRYHRDAPVLPMSFFRRFVRQPQNAMKLMLENRANTKMKRQQNDSSDKKKIRSAFPEKRSDDQQKKDTSMISEKHSEDHPSHMKTTSVISENIDASGAQKKNDNTTKEKRFDQSDIDEMPFREELEKSSKYMMRFPYVKGIDPIFGLETDYMRALIEGPSAEDIALRERNESIAKGLTFSTPHPVKVLSVDNKGNETEIETHGSTIIEGEEEQVAKNAAKKLPSGKTQTQEPYQETAKERPSIGEPQEIVNPDNPPPEKINPVYPEMYSHFDMSEDVPYQEGNPYNDYADPYEPSVPDSYGYAGDQMVNDALGGEAGKRIQSRKTPHMHSMSPGGYYSYDPPWNYLPYYHENVRRIAPDGSPAESTSASKRADSVQVDAKRNGPNMSLSSVRKLGTPATKLDSDDLNQFRKKVDNIFKLIKTR